MEFDLNFGNHLQTSSLPGGWGGEGADLNLLLCHVLTFQLCSLYLSF